MNNQRGAVLGIVIITALICAIAAYAVLQASVSEARHAKVVRGRVESRYLAEAAIVIAREQLWQDPAFCLTSQPVAVDTDGDGAGDTNVTVTITSCGAGNAHAIQATATY